MFKKKHVDIARKSIKKIPKRIIEQLVPKEEISWEAAEFYFYPKNKYWIMGIGILMLGLDFLLIAAAQYFKYELVFSDYLLLIALGLMIVVFGQYGHVTPKKYAAELRQTGLLNRGKFYPYDSIKSFWIIETPNPTLYFELVAISLPVSVLLEDQSVEEVRSYLLRYLPEHPTATEHITDKLSHFLRF